MMTLAQAALHMSNATIRGNAAAVFKRVHTDSRTLQSEDLFVAIKGERFDAHAFLPQVHALGDCTALISAQHLPPEGLNVIVVPDPKKALGELAAAWRRRFTLPLAVVTGSNGKTTTKDMIATIFKTAVGQEHVLYTLGNLNNDIGLPLTLLKLNATHRLAVIELGMNHPGETATLAAIAEPTIALVNNAQREHQEFMATVEAVAQEHAAAIQALPAEGIAVFPANDAHAPVWRSTAGGRKRIEFGVMGTDAKEEDVAEEIKNTLALIFMRLSNQNSLEIRMKKGDRLFWYPIFLQIQGVHNQLNALAAASVALAAGVTPECIVQGLNAFAPSKGRMQNLPGFAYRLIDDSYNANPDSVRAAIDALAADSAATKVLVLGDMGEVGEQGPAFHSEVGHYAAAMGIDALITFGEATQLTHATYKTAMSTGIAKHAGSVRQAADIVRELSLLSNACVLIKGSRFMQMERVIEELKKPSQGASAC